MKRETLMHSRRLTWQCWLPFWAAITLTPASVKADAASDFFKGKVVRSGYVRPDTFNINGYNPGSSGQEEAIIEVAGKLQFGLPGTPVFPDLTSDTILKPRLEWMISTDKGGKFPAEFSYVTGGMSWQADYNVVAPEKGDLVDIIGWVTMDNRTGKTFENARIKLMAGDVNKIQPGVSARAFNQMVALNAGAARGVTSSPSPMWLMAAEIHVTDLTVT